MLNPLAAMGSTPPPKITHIIGLSGGKDSTCLALLMKEREPYIDFTYLITPTGDELPEMVEHWRRLEVLLGKPLTVVQAGTLAARIKRYNALPSFRMRWCTRELKIEPAIAYYKAHMPAIAYIGLRADEEANVRTGILGSGIPQRFPLREMGWGLKEVQGFLKERGIVIPKRTDCARCYGQRLGEWEALFWEHPDLYADSERQESETGFTFRSPRRDTKPAALKELRVIFEARGKPEEKEGAEDEDDGRGKCRVCSL